MVPGLDDARVEPEPVAVVVGDELELLDVEAELVQAVQALVDHVAAVGAEDLLARQLVPERLVAGDELRRGLLGRQLARRPSSASMSNSSPTTFSSAIARSCPR